MSEQKKFHNHDAVLDIHDRPKTGHWIGLSLQHLFTMFGATVLVPILVGIDPGIALVSSGSDRTGSQGPWPAPLWCCPDRRGRRRSYPGDLR